MPKEFHRSERVAELIHRVVSDVIRNEVHDPRVRMVTVTDIQLSRDLGVAKLYFTSLDDSDNLDEIADVLTKASSFIRRRVGKEVRLRVTPELRFFKDEAELRGREMSALIDSVMDGEQGTSDAGDSEPPSDGQEDHGTTS